MPEGDQAAEGYVESQPWGLDHPNAKRMDNFYMVTMNNEHIKRGYIPSSEIQLVKDEIEIMGGMERLFAGGHLDVETVRAIEAGKFTLDRAVESARDGFFVRMEHSQINIDQMLAPTKKRGFLSGLFGRGKEEPQMYRGEVPYRQ